jgi:competence protein ComEC
VPWWGLAAVLTVFSIGIMVAQLMSPLPACLSLAVLLGAGVAILRPRHAVLICLALAALLLGALRGSLASTPSLPAALDGQDSLVTGQVDDDPIDRKTSRRLVVRVDQVSGLATRRLRLEATVYGMTPVHYGDLVLLGGVIQRPQRFEQFDYRAYLAEQGIAAVMPSARLLRVTSHPGDPLHTLLFAARHGVVGAVDRSLPEPQAALLLGVVFGYRAALPSLLQQAMVASGLIHIVVISGLKVSLLARIVQGALGRWLPRCAPAIAAAAMVGYALLAGASAAALRAAGMGMLVLIAGRLGRESQVYVSLALTAALMLALKPALASDVSFQLSFAGTIGIASMTDSVAARLPWLPHLLRDPLAATVAAEAATWPLMLANFHQVSLIGPLANALVLPLLPAVMVLGGAGAAISPLGAAFAWAPMQAAGLIVAWYRIVIEHLGGMPMAALVMPYFPGRWLAAATLINGAGLTGIRLRHFFWQRRIWAVLGSALVIVIALLLVIPDGKIHVYALDVGTGSAVLIRTSNGHQLLIDEGPDADRFAQAIGRTLPATARDLDLWLITGGRRANIGAGTVALNRFSVKNLVVSDPDAWSASLRSLVEQAQASGVPVAIGNGPYVVDGVTLSLAADGRNWMIGTLSGRIAVVPPDTSWLSTPSDIDGAIFTAGGPTEWQGPAHGFSVIQVAGNSRDGLPARSVLQAMSGAPIYRTDRLGSVELRAEDTGLVPAAD